MTYNYKIGYHSYEESDDFELSHDMKFSQEELAMMIAKICKGLVTEGGRNTFQNIYYSVKDELIQYHGFKEIEYEIEYSVFGWADILNENDWKDSGDTLEDLRKKIKELND